jgi:hypothetical protein
MLLRPYQLLIRDHVLEHDRCAVWAGMGPGKTASTLAALEVLNSGRGCQARWLE